VGTSLAVVTNDGPIYKNQHEVKPDPINYQFRAIKKNFIKLTKNVKRLKAGITQWEGFRVEFFSLDGLDSSVQIEEIRTVDSKLGPP